MPVACCSRNLVCANVGPWLGNTYLQSCRPTSSFGGLDAWLERVRERPVKFGRGAQIQNLDDVGDFWCSDWIFCMQIRTDVPS